MSWRSGCSQSRAARAGRLALLGWYVLQVLVLLPRHQYLVTHDDAAGPLDVQQIERLVGAYPESGSGTHRAPDSSPSERHEQRTCALCAVNRPVVTPDTQPAPVDTTPSQLVTQPLPERLARASAPTREPRAPPSLSS